MVAFAASIYPLTPFIFYLFNWVELKVRMNKMLNLSRRVKAKRVAGIGTWQQYVQFFALDAIPINLLVIT